VIEVSGVADPAVAAGWATVPPFEPAGVIVLADATSVVRRSRDRWVGSEVTRQVAGADLVVVTKTDACGAGELAEVERWVAVTSGGAPSIRVVEGRVPPDVILGVRVRPSGPARGDLGSHDRHLDPYVSWSWSSPAPVPRAALEGFLADLPAGLLRVKGRLRLDDGSGVVLQIVGRRVDLTPSPSVDTSELVAIAVRGTIGTDPFALHFG
jgi:G3E family GTPase